MKKWLLLQESKVDNEEDIIDVLLRNRGIKTKKEVENFLNPTLSQLSWEKVGLKKWELDKAVGRIKKALENKEAIIVYTDYDVDGVASGAIVWETLYEAGANSMPYVPHRIEEGYGLSQKGIDTIYKKYNAKLIITVDHGVGAWEKVKYAKKLGIDVIIIDHHTLPPKLPKVAALVHTTSLCATAVAWFFVNYLVSKLRSKDYSALFTSGESFGHPRGGFKNLDLVALATIADLIPLTGINRILVKYGLEQLNKTKRLGLLSLIKASGLKLGELGVYEVGHMLAPRINASGRLSHALDSLRLLCTKDEARADLLAQKLSLTNRERQLILEETTTHAKSLSASYLKKKLIFLSHETYNQGVIGLVAGRLVEEFYRPAIVVSRGKKYSKASARSIAGFNIVEAIRACSDLLVDVGGHPMAAGFTVETSKLLLLEEKLVRFAEKELIGDKLQRVLKIDCEINLESVNLKLYERIKKLSPFGIGNPEPTFLSKNIKVIGVKLMGKEKNHLRLVLKINTNSRNSAKLGFWRDSSIINAIGFGMGELYAKINFETPVDIVYTIDEDNWNNNSNLQLKLKDVKFPKV